MTMQIRPAAEIGPTACELWCIDGLRTGRCSRSSQAAIVLTEINDSSCDSPPRTPVESLPCSSTCMRHGTRTTPRSRDRRRDTRGLRRGRSRSPLAASARPRSRPASKPRANAGSSYFCGMTRPGMFHRGVSRSAAWALFSFFWAPRPRPCADSGAWTAHVVSAAVAAAAVKSLFQFCITPEPGSPKPNAKAAGLTMCGWRRLRVQVMSQSGAVEMFAGESFEQGAEPLAVQREGRGVA